MDHFECYNCKAYCLTDDNNCDECGNIFCLECKDDPEDICRGCTEEVEI
jgi:hypothetical protein